MRGAIASLVLAGALAAGLPARAAAARLPELTGSFGGTFGVTGGVGEGGLSAALAALWVFDGPFSFGPMLFVDDLGTQLGRLRDPNDGTDLGAVALDHGLTYGAAWRLDARLRSRGAWQPFASTTWGAYRVQADELGIKHAAGSATGASFAAGMRFVRGGGADPATAGFGLSVRHHRVFHERLRDYTSVSVDWIWPMGAGAPRAAEK